jgi:hypothetical protein
MFILLGTKPWRVAAAGLIAIVIGVSFYGYLDHKERAHVPVRLESLELWVYREIGKGGICGLLVGFGLYLIGMAAYMRRQIRGLEERDRSVFDSKLLPPEPIPTWMARPMWFRAVTAGLVPIALGLAVVALLVALHDLSSDLLVLAVGLVVGGIVVVGGGLVLRRARPHMVDLADGDSHEPGKFG